MPVIFSDLPPDQVARWFSDIHYDFMEVNGMLERLYYQDGIAVPLCSVCDLRHLLARSERGM